MVPRLLAGLVATALLVTGIIALASTITAAPDGRGLVVRCGSAFAPDDSQANLFAKARELDAELTGNRPELGGPGAIYAWACDDAIGMRRLWAWPLAGIGALGLVAAVAVRRRRSAE
ncbi:hypothetical protein [Amycolatopsis minnesotensis]|uniref:hypothetical protein n=1 Tax=Amycolatopsis minnesotensis TaxID=337894 RepID=UPI0031D154E0